MALAILLYNHANKACSIEKNKNKKIKLRLWYLIHKRSQGNNLLTPLIKNIDIKCMT